MKPLEKKLGKLYTFSLLAGKTCPTAKDCKAHVENGKVVDGKDSIFRCFSASQEALFPNVYMARKNNTDIIISCKNDVTKMKNVIISNLPKDASVIRIHVSGDFLTRNYFKAWIEVAKENPNILFYGYTKRIKFVVDAKNEIPDNLNITCSYGGTEDYLIDKHNLKCAYVVHEPEEAILVKRYRAKNKMPKGSKYAGLKIDHDDSNAALSKNSFTLLLHNIQKAGTKASKTLSILDGVGSYN